MLVLFDLDDTLLDDTSATSAAVKALHDQLGSNESLDQFRARWSSSLRHHFGRYVSGEISFDEQRRSRIRDAVQLALPDSAADQLFARYLAAYERSWALFADVVPCFDALQGCVLGIVSNGDSRQQRAKLSRLGILDRFACVVLSGELGIAKPDRRIFSAACERCGIAAGDTIHVGDNFDLDVLGASGAGLRPVWLDRLDTSGHAESREFSVIRTLAELPRLVATARGAA